MIDHDLLRVGNIFSFVFYYWRLFLDETIKRQDIICILSRLQLYTAAKTIARTLCGLFFFIPISGSRCHERLAPTHPPLSLRFIFFGMWPTRFVIFHHSSLFFFTQPTSSYNESKRNTSKKRREKGRDRKKERDKNNEEEEVRYYWSTLSRRMS